MWPLGFITVQPLEIFFLQYFIDLSFLLRNHDRIALFYRAATFLVNFHLVWHIYVFFDDGNLFVLERILLFFSFLKEKRYAAVCLLMIRTMKFNIKSNYGSNVCLNKYYIFLISNQSIKFTFWCHATVVVPLPRLVAQPTCHNYLIMQYCTSSCVIIIFSNILNVNCIFCSFIFSFHNITLKCCIIK